jgi:hypothetical protein
MLKVGATMPEYRRLITVPLTTQQEQAGDDMPQGERPDRLRGQVEAIRRYVLGYRLPDTMQDVAVYVEPRIRAEARVVANTAQAELVMDLILFTSGQLPLRFRARRGEGPNAALDEEMDRLAENFRVSLIESNPVWVEGAAIAANDPAPAADIQYLRWKSGRQAPKPAPKSVMAALMQIAADETALPLVIPETRPEYVEPHEVEIHVHVSPWERQLMMTVSAIFGSPVPDGSQSMLMVGSRLRPRVAEQLRQRFTYLACMACLLNIPLKLKGRTVVSMGGLRAKAFEISRVLNREDVCGGLDDFTQGL